jgi:hypothetical protein
LPQHLEIAKEVGDRAGEGIAYGNLGNAHKSQGGFSQAIKYHTQHLEIAKEVGLSSILLPPVLLESIPPKNRPANGTLRKKTSALFL